MKKKTSQAVLSNKNVLGSKRKNVLGSKRKTKRSDQSMQQERNAVPDDEITTSVSKKRRGSSKRKGTEESNSKEQNVVVLNDKTTTSVPKRRTTSSKKRDVKESNSSIHEIIGAPSNPHPYSQESFGFGYQSQQNVAFLCTRFPNSGVQSVPSDFSYEMPSLASFPQVMPYRPDGPHIYQVGASSSQAIPNQALGYQVIPPTFVDYSLMNSQETARSIPEGSTRQLNFDPSMS